MSSTFNTCRLVGDVLLSWAMSAASLPGILSGLAGSVRPGPQFPHSSVFWVFWGGLGTSMPVLSPALGQPRERRLQTGCQVCVNHRNTRVSKCVDEYRYVCVWLFFIFLLFAPLHLSHIFLPSDPSSKSILWYKISHHLIHSTKINQLPCRHLP